MVGVTVSSSRVGVGVTVAGSVCVAAGRVAEGVAVVTTKGTRTYVDIIANRKPVAMIIGIAYLRSMSGNAAEAVAGFSPVCPMASSRFLRLAA
jgi:hypothetical protein